MKTITRLESLLENLVEHSFARLFRARLQPIEIAKRLTREMEAERVVGVNSVLVPNRYTVALHPGDFAALAPIRLSLEQETAQYLRTYAREHGYGMTAAPEVQISDDPAVHARHMLVRASLTEAPVVPQLETERLAHTVVMPSPAVNVALPESVVPGDAYLTLDGATYPLTGLDISLGRGLENTIVLDDRRISRSHARLQRINGHWTVYDEGSTNGSFVNGRMIAQHALKDGDQLSLGGLELVFHQRWEGA